MAIISGQDDTGTLRTVLTDNEGRLVTIEQGGTIRTTNLVKGTQSVAATNKVVLASYTVPVGKFAWLVQAVCSSSVRGLYEIKINGTVEYRVRTSGSDKTVILPTYEVRLSAGDTVVVDVTNDYHSARQFDITLQVYELDE